MKESIIKDKKQIKSDMKNIENEIWEIDRLLQHDLLLKRERLWKQYITKSKELEHIRQLEKSSK